MHFGRIVAVPYQKRYSCAKAILHLIHNISATFTLLQSKSADQQSIELLPLSGSHKGLDLMGNQWWL